MDDDVNPAPRWINPETDLTEGNAWRDGTELIAERPLEATDKGVWIDPEFGPTILP